ncbi:MAG: hypothetical protein IH792_06230 [Thaumarchaeota archaeon]|nr:hypothetical protein [Nitrososphaerota archaeon]
MHIEYEEFDTIEDFFMYMASAAPPMKNTMPVNSYKGYVMSFIPLSPITGETYLMLYSKGSLESGIYEFDVSSKSYKKVETIERADKVYFISITPKRNTIADVAIENL